MPRLTLTDPQRSALECAGIFDADDLPTLAATWDRYRHLHWTPEQLDPLCEELTDRCNAEDAVAEQRHEGWHAAAGAARALLTLQQRVRAATT